MVGMHQIHSLKSLLIMSAASSAVVGLLEALYTYGDEEVSYSQKVVTEFLIDESTVCKCMECAVIMLLAQTDQICLAHKRLASGIHIEVNAKLFSLLNHAVNLIKCKI